MQLNSRWAAYAFAIPKYGNVRSKYFKPDKYIGCKLLPTLKISDMLLKLESFQWATVQDLTISYCSSGLDPDMSPPS